MRWLCLDCGETAPDIYNNGPHTHLNAKGWVKVDTTNQSSQMPDAYDRQLGMLHDLPDVVKTKPTTVTHVTLMGVGGTQVFIVQTYRQREKGDTIFLQSISQAGTVRLVLPPTVANIIARHRDSLTTKVRKKISKARAEDLKAQGILPGFMKKKEEVK